VNADRDIRNFAESLDDGRPEPADDAVILDCENASAARDRRSRPESIGRS
jgi:hypothetical protein